MASKKAPPTAPAPELPLSQRPQASPALEAALLEFSTLEDQVATLQEQLSEKKARAKYLGENVMVELVELEHLNDGCRLTDGREFTFERDVKCGIAKDKKPEAFAWLASKGADTMLKRYLTISFGKDSLRQVSKIKTMLAQVLPQYEIGVKVGKAPDTIVEAVKELLRAADVQVEVEETLELPGSTLSSFVKKEIKAGRSLPEYFGVYAPLRAIPVPPAPEPAEVPGPVGG
jgi:hypothetical protein